ncbi:unnamed protein product [Protopolystoma xenopodis]|uniref:Uncharacterized protein n=1 Tax=Protopolystoma xenopodis TaxID=117903 RepID=A0A448WZX7_9PLAT|nr:unnamed protein product [Protopolystoma xenopodis]
MFIEYLCNGTLQRLSLKPDRVDSGFAAPIRVHEKLFLLSISVAHRPKDPNASCTIFHCSSSPQLSIPTDLLPKKV